MNKSIIQDNQSDKWISKYIKRFFIRYYFFSASVFAVFSIRSIYINLISGRNKLNHSMIKTVLTS
jgi:hypothetical protein